MKTGCRGEKAKKNRKLKGTNLLEDHKSRKENGKSSDVQFEHLHHYQAGDTVTEDINCDSPYILKNMPKVGKAIRDAYFWVPEDKHIYLVLDSAGGDNANAVIAQYNAMM